MRQLLDIQKGDVKEKLDTEMWNQVEKEYLREVKDNQES